MQETRCIGIVEREPADALRLQHALRAKGLPSRTFASPGAALTSPAVLQELSCLVCEVRLPGISGLQLQRELVRLDLKLPMIFVYGQATASEAFVAYEQGAIAFLEKPVDEVRLLAAVRRAEEVQLAKRQADDGQTARLAALSERERQVLDALVQGRVTKVIARDLQISPSTVEKHRSSIFKKVRVDSVVELTRLVLTGPHTAHAGLGLSPPKSSLDAGKA